MKMNTKEMFQVGYFKFHDNEALNFQLNRFYAQGAFTREELIKIGSQIDGFENWISLFIKIGEEAQNQGDVFKAATCFRAAQFYTLSGEKDENGNSLKHLLYDRCVRLYDEYFGRFEDIKYVNIASKNISINIFIKYEINI